MPSRAQILIFIRNLFRILGLEVRFRSLKSSFDLRLRHFIKIYEIDNVYDIGANKGQFLKQILSFNFKGKVNCYEPIPSAARCLIDFTKQNANVRVFNFALSNSQGRQKFYITTDLASSSLLESSQIVDYSSGRASIIDEIEVVVHRLDDLKHIFGDGERNFMKIDVQGSELAVLEGARLTLKNCVMVLIEVSLTELYAGQSKFDEVIAFMLAEGFKVLDLFDSFRSETDGSLLQADMLFVRNVN